MTYDELYENAEATLKDLRAFVDQGEAFERLKANSDFQSIIVQGYLRDKAASLVSLLATKVSQKETLLGELTGMSYLNAHFTTLEVQLANARRTIRETEDNINEVRVAQATGISFDDLTEMGLGNI